MSAVAVHHSGSRKISDLLISLVDRVSKHEFSFLANYENLLMISFSRFSQTLS